MALLVCSRCMKPVSGDAGCPYCGFHPKDYQSPPNALPPGTIIGGCTIGIVLNSSRQAICYSAKDSSLDSLVLLEEFFPSAAVKRDGNNVVQTRAEARLSEAAELFGNAEGGHGHEKLITVMKENNTVYREYRLDSADMQTPEKAAEALLDEPIRFRDKDNRPLFSINALPIPSLPEKREIVYKRSGRKGRRLAILALVIALILVAGLYAVWKLRL